MKIRGRRPVVKNIHEPTPTPPRMRKEVTNSLPIWNLIHAGSKGLIMKL
jgi:hypothetical protein